MANPFIGEIRAVGFNFAPLGWATCNGQLMAIEQNTALFSLIGTTYGGDGEVTFALPDLRGRVAMDQGQGPGLSNHTAGEEGGSEAVTLTTNQMPAHGHTFSAADATATTSDPHSGVFATPFVTGRFQPLYDAAQNGAAAANMIASSSGNQPHDNLQPYLSVQYIIALEGIFPGQ